jgi:hypothetical protein
MKQTDYEKLFKALLVMNQAGLYIQARDGHTWIVQAPNVYRNYKLNKILLDTKFYGGIKQAIETFNEALIMDVQPSLMEDWKELSEDILFLGEGGVDESRITKVEDGKGGIN